MTKKASILKMFNPAEEDRIIDDLPIPLYKNSSPYPLNFSSQTLEICHNNERIIASSLKICKAIILGDVCVGKTSIVNRFCHKYFESNYKSTIGIDFEVERFDILKVPFHLQIWDTAGQERFKCIAQSYYRASKVIIIVFDLSSIQSLGNCKNWYDDVIENCDQDPFIFLVGSKKDLLSPAAYENVEHSALKIAKLLNAEFWAVSARTGENIDTFFFRVAALAFDDLVCAEIDKRLITIGQDLVTVKTSPRLFPKKVKCNETNCNLL